ncbi:MAG: glycosyltransferase family 4 protein [Bacilli bacterium]
MGKTITFLLMYYDPEFPTVNLIYQSHIDQCLAQGMSVNIITPNPTRGVSREVQKAYKKRKYEQLSENCHLYRVSAFTYRRFHKFHLLLRYLSVSYRCARKLKKVNSDIVFLQTSPPIFYAYFASKVAKKRGMKIYYDVQDIYPDNIFKKGTLIYRVVNRLQKKILQRADIISTISRDMVETLKAKGDFAAKIQVNPNPATYPIAVYDGKKLAQVKEKFNFNDAQKTILYAGNIGYLQDIDLFLAAAKLLISRSDLVFKIVGEGSQAQRIKARIAEENLTNCEFYPMTSNEESAYLYKLADLNYIALLPGVIYTACPLKTAMIVQAGKPTIAAVDADSLYLEDLKAHGFPVLVVPNRDYHLLKTKIEEFFPMQK